MLIQRSRGSSEASLNYRRSNDSIPKKEKIQTEVDLGVKLLLSQIANRDAFHTLRTLLYTSIVHNLLAFENLSID